jgi:hypothetical protein
VAFGLAAEVLLAGPARRPTLLSLGNQYEPSSCIGEDGDELPAARYAQSRRPAPAGTTRALQTHDRVSPACAPQTDHLGKSPQNSANETFCPTRSRRWPRYAPTELTSAFYSEGRKLDQDVAQHNRCNQSSHCYNPQRNHRGTINRAHDAPDHGAPLPRRP